MIDLNVTEQPNSIEELFCKKFSELTKYPMNNETVQIFVKLILSKNIDSIISENEKPFIYKLLEKRILVFHDYKVDERILLFLYCILDTPSVAVMYCWYLQYESKIRGIDVIDFRKFSEIFGSGFPSDDALQKIWESQKVENKDRGISSDNLLDYPKAGFSLFKKQNN
jgi:hypothetical protein